MLKKIDNTQENSMYMLRGGKDGTINRIISECKKLVRKEYKTCHGWV